MLPSLPGHTWRYSTADRLRHQDPTDTPPDGEGLVTAACDQAAFAGRVRDATDNTEPHCPDCLMVTTAAAATRIEQAAHDRARTQRAELRGGTFGV